MAEKKSQPTEAVIAPAPIAQYVPPAVTAPRMKQIERQGDKSVPYTEYYPQVRGGICEYCGVLDKNVPSEFQYKLCGHYRGMQLRCSYCEESKNPNDVIYHSVLNIHGHPDNPDKLVIVCDAYECSRKHEARFNRSRQ